MRREPGRRRGGSVIKGGCDKGGVQRDDKGCVRGCERVCERGCEKEYVG